MLKCQKSYNEHINNMYTVLLYRNNIMFNILLNDSVNNFSLLV